MPGPMNAIRRLQSTDFSVPVRLLLLAGPIIASMISRTIMSFVDFAMVSQLGTQAQAAILPAGMVLFCIVAFGMGLVGSVNTLVSQAYGRGLTRDCSTYAWQGIYLSFALAVIMLPGWFIVTPFFNWVGHPDSVQEMESIYTRIGLLSIAPQVAAVAIANFFNGIHRPTVGFIAAVASNIFNAIANYALIFGHFGFDPMGIAGAAWGTLAASVFQMLILLGWMLSPSVAGAYQTGVAWRWRRSHVAALLRVGLPTAMQFTLDIMAFTIFTLFLIGRFGTTHLAANNVAFKFLELSFMPAVGLGTAVLSTVGKSIGERRPDMARLNARWAARINVGYMGTIALLFLVIPRQLTGLLTDDPAVLDVAANMLRIFAIYQIFDALGITYNHALRGAGDTQWPAMIGAILAGGVMLLGGWAVAMWLPHWKSYGPWAAATVYIALYGLLMWYRFARGTWEKIELMPASEG